MDEARKRKLRAKGWEFGDAREFWGLSREEAAYIELKLALGRSLRMRRSQRKITQARLAELIKSSQSRVAKMEAGDPSVSLDLLIRSLLALGVSRKDLVRAMSSETPIPAA